MHELGLSTQPTAPARKRGSPERGLHITVAAFLRRALPPEILAWHTPNGEHRDPRTAAKLKAFGTLAGVPDLCILLPGGRLAMIELKAPKGAMTPGQREFRGKALALGALYAECRSLDDVVEIVTHWLKPFGLALRARVSA